MSNTLRAKRYTIDLAGLITPCALGSADLQSGTRIVWDAFAATEQLAELQAQPGFDAESYCTRCEEYDRELAIQPHQLRLPRLRPEKLRQLMKEPVALPWQPGKPSADVRVKGWQKARPAHPARLDGCHNCLLSFLDEQELPDVAPARVAELKAAARAERHEVFRLRKAQANPHNGPDLAAYIDRLIEAARLRLRLAVRACWDAGFQPWRPTSRRVGEDAPAEVVATTWERPEEAA